MKKMAIVFLLCVNSAYSMDKPVRIAAGQMPKESEFLKHLQYSPGRAMRMIGKGYALDYAELYHLASFGDDQGRFDKEYFWLHWGVEFLLNARFKPADRVDSLRALAAKQASKTIAKDSSKKAAFEKKFAMLPLKLKNLVITQDVELTKRKWKELLNELEDKNPQSFLNGLEQLVVFWTAILNTPNTLLAQKLLKRLIKTKRYKNDPEIARKIDTVIESLKQLLAEAQCQNARHIIEYLRAKGLLVNFTNVITREFADSIRTARVTGSAGTFEADQRLILELLRSDYHSCLKNIKSNLDR
jgi:hypothetical protein